jgi:hypothetical protein
VEAPGIEERSDLGITRHIPAFGAISPSADTPENRGLPHDAASYCARQDFLRALGALVEHVPGARVAVVHEHGGRVFTVAIPA